MGLSLYASTLLNLITIREENITKGLSNEGDFCMVFAEIIQIYFIVSFENLKHVAAEASVRNEFLIQFMVEQT